MSYKYSFADNKIYSANDINAITKRLVTSGIEDSFTDGVAYNVSKFNEAGKLLYTSGAVPESCLSLKVEDAGEGKILINPGKAFFDDGAVIEIEAGGETLPYVSGSKNYVYLKNDLINTNRCYPCCTVSEPEGDHVLLAEIDASANIQDKRTYAKGKLPGYQSVAGNVMRLQGEVEITEISNDYPLDQVGSKTFDIGNNNYEYILIYVTPIVNTDSYKKRLPCLGIYNILEQSYLGFYGDKDVTDSVGKHLRFDAGVSENYLHLNTTNNRRAQMTFALDNGKLTVSLRVHASTNAESAIGVRFPIDLILF